MVFPPVSGPLFSKTIIPNLGRTTLITSYSGARQNWAGSCRLLLYSNTNYLNDAGKMLCVSADALAKIKHASLEWLDDIEDKVIEFEDGGRNAQDC